MNSMHWQSTHTHSHSTYSLESWTSPLSYFSWFTPNTNTIRCNLVLTPCSHLFEGELIHWVAKANNLWLMVRCALHAGARAIYLTSQACENDISIIIPEYYSRLTPIVIFQKYLNFNDISRKCTHVCSPLWSLLLWRFLLWRFLKYQY